MEKGITFCTTRSFASLCRQSQVGKKLPDALYIHISAVVHLPSELQQHYSKGEALLPAESKFNLIKFNYDGSRISYLFYCNFDTEPHPVLHSSIQVNLMDRTVQIRNYSLSDNPPILHRKECSLAPDYPGYAQFCELTRQEDALSLLNSNHIGTRKGWEVLLSEKKIQLNGNQIVSLSNQKIERHKAAIHRNALSKPVRLALESRILHSELSFYDYGCGYGEDIQRLRKQGFTCYGFDPYYYPNGLKNPSDIVNLGYVINVIEDPVERREALLEAWKLTQKVLIVSAQVLVNDMSNGQIAYGDGVLSSRNTFQKYYEQEELKNYIDQVLEVDSIPVALGIYFIFRDETQAQSFRVSYFRSYATTPRISSTNKKFADYQEILLPLMQFFTERGRLPSISESNQFTEITREFGSIRKAFNLILRATNQSEWDAITDKRRQDILVFLALSNFDKHNRKLKLTDLSLTLQTDIKILFGSYQSACTTAELMLFNLGKSGFIRSICERSKIGWLDKKYLTVHISTLESLDIMLRLYEGCASKTFGRMDNTNLIRFHLDKPKIVYMYCPNFDKEPHPKIESVIYVSLREPKVFYQDYSQSDNPFIVHRKSALVFPDYPSCQKFNRLTQHEERWGLLSEIGCITSSNDWNLILQKHSASLKGHRLFRNKETTE